MQSVVGSGDGGFSDLSERSCNTDLRIGYGLLLQSVGGHVQVGSLGGAPPLGKDSQATLRSAQAGQEPAAECKGKSWLDGIHDNKGCRGESLA